MVHTRVTRSNRLQFKCLLLLTGTSVILGYKRPKHEMTLKLSTRNLTTSFIFLYGTRYLYILRMHMKWYPGNCLSKLPNFKPQVINS